MKSPQRVVLDTNVVLSSLLFARGRLVPLRRAWQQQMFQPLVSKATAEELLRVLRYPKFKLNHDGREELLGDYLPFCATVLVTKSLKIPSCRDQFDVPFLALAVAGKADYLVTGDQDLLALAGELTCSIVTAKEFLLSLAVETDLPP